MAEPRLRLHRMRNRDGVILTVATAAFLAFGELTNPVLRSLFTQYVGGQANPLLAAGAIVLVFVAYTPAFGCLLALLAALLFAQNELSRGRFFLGLGIGFSLLGLMSKIALAVLSENAAPVVWFATTATGLGVLLGVAAQIVMSSHVMKLKKRWRKLRRLRERRAGAPGNVAAGDTPPARRPPEERTNRRSPQLPDH